jgi:mannan endo-1,4-beta-mannosidase
VKYQHCILKSFLLLFFFGSCQKEESVANSNSGYQITNSNISYNSKNIQLIGANAFHVFGAGSADMNSWNLDIAREFIGNIKETPLTGNPIQDSHGAYLYSIQNIVDENRKQNKISWICAFGWDGNPSTLFTGKSPATTFWWEDYKAKLRLWAIQFKDQNDVWIEVWNEPYRYDRADGYTDAIWLQNMNELTEIIRATGNKNIVVIPCAEQGQDESVLLNKGNAFLAGKSNILFDIHAYEKWLLDSSTNINSRLDALNRFNIPIIFGETAPMNAGVLMNPESFLNLIYDKGISVCAWVWKKDESDQDALMTQNGLPNNINNNNWGTTFKNLALKTRNPKP